MKKIVVFIVLIFMAIGPHLSFGASEEEPVAVLVAPFQVYSKKPLDYLTQAFPHLLSSRLDAEKGIRTIDESVVPAALKKLNIKTLTEQNARTLGMDTGADWVILGTITKKGEDIILDAKLVGVTGDKETISESYQENSLKKLIDGVGVFAKQVSYKILGKVPVADIAIKGNRMIEDVAVLEQIKTKAGDVYSPEALQEDIRIIYNMGFFSDIKVDTIDEASGKKIIFVVKENPEIAQIKITGNNEVTIKDIEKQIDIKPHTVLSNTKATANTLKIKKFYEGKGYNKVLVSYKTEDLSPEQVALVFQIVEHHPMQVKKIKITGNSNLKAKKIKSVMETREKNLLSILTQAGTFKEDALKADRERITAYYYDFGYLDVKVGLPEVTNDAKWFYITIPIEEGVQYHLNDVNISGDIIETKKPLKKQLTVTKGEIFSRQKLQKDIEALTEAYGEYGFAFVDITPLTKINADSKTVDLTYDINKGKEVYFEKINITGNTKTRDKVIRREMRIKEEELYNNKKLKKSRERLNNLGYFEEVKINTQKGSEPDKMNVEVNVKEKPTGMISAGAGYSSVDSIMGVFQVSQNNFLGKGYQASFMAQVGKNPRYRIALTNPYIFDKEISAGFDLFRYDTWYEDFDSLATGLNLNFGFLPFKDNEDVRLDFEYSYSSTEIKDLDREKVYVKDENGDYILDEDGHPITDHLIYNVDRDTWDAYEQSPIKISSITPTLSRNTIDDRFYPMSGSSNSISLQFAGLTGEKFIKGIVDSRWYFPFKWATAFSIRGAAGWAMGYGGDEVPVTQRFFLGGLDSLRGMKDREVGPRGKGSGYLTTQKYLTPDYLDADNTCAGGNKMAFCQFEYLFPLIKAAKIRGLVFFDAGSSWGGPGEDTSFELREDVGVGIRWNSPFGPLRVDWGINLNKKDGESGSNFGFSAGAGF